MNIIEERLGPVHAARLIAKLGGCRITVPGDLRDEGRITKLERMFGRELTVLIVLHFGDQSLYVPHGDSRQRVEMADVVRLTLERKSAAVIARELRCSDRTVYGWRSRAKALGLLPPETISTRVA